MGFLGSLTKMKITSYEDETFASEAGEFTVMINPEKYTHNYEICYNDVQAQGSNGASPEFNRVLGERMSFELVFDGTGVVPSAIPGIVPYTGDGIASQIQKFRDVVFKYEGNVHSTKLLRLKWGKLTFQCRLTTLEINFTLFKPDGTPLRARANASFVKYNSPDELARMANTSSPDLSHLLTVKSGDTLPLMCHRVYGSSAYYPQVARANGLTDFRELVPGTQLLFPPLGEVPA